MSSIQPILDRALAGERLTADDCTALLESHDIARIGVAADEIRQQKHPGGVGTYIIDRNINYTNVCNVVCTFCAFYRRPGKPDTYVHSVEEICRRIDETIAIEWPGKAGTRVPTMIRPVKLIGSVAGSSTVDELELPPARSNGMVSGKANCSPATPSTKRPYRISPRASNRR